MSELTPFRIGPIRPPSEADSLLLQVTRGCTWNRCRFCTIYKGERFKAYSADSVKRDIDSIAGYAEIINRYKREDGLGADPRWDLEGLNAQLDELEDEEQRQCFYTVANWLIKGGEKVFLQDGNTTALSSGRLSDVIIYLKETFPNIKRITSYGRAENLARYDSGYYAELKAAGLDRIHSGFESGSDKVLELINKGTTSHQQIKAGKAIKAGGIELSIYFMPGIGGRDLTDENAEGTARVVREVEPDYLRVRTAAIKRGTELYEMYEEGSYRLCGDDEKVREIRKLILLAEGSHTKVVSDHMVNLLQSVEGSLSKDGEDHQAGDGRRSADLKDMLGIIDGYLEMSEVDRRVFQLLRRTLRAYDPEDMKRIGADQMEALRQTVAGASDDEWDAKINEHICNYI